MREINLALKFDTASPFQFQSVPIGALFMRVSEGTNGNIYAKPSKRRKNDSSVLVFNITRPGICIFCQDTENVYLRVF